MENFQYCLPTRYIFGQGVSSKVGQTISDLGYKKVLIVYGGGSAVRSGLISSIKEQLASFSIGYTLLGGVIPNPRADLVYEGINLVTREFEEKAKTLNQEEQQRYYMQLQERLANKERELMVPLMDKINAAIKKVATTKGLSVVVDKQSVIYGGTDITEDVIKAYK